MENLEEQILLFLKAITSGTTNKIISTRVNEKYFVKSGNKHLWDAFQNVIDNLHCDKSQAIVFIKSGIYKERPKCCVCGAPVTISDRAVSKYCSKKCALSDSSRSEKISKTKLATDHSASNLKRQQTMIEKYGVPFNSKREDIHHLWCKTKLPLEIYEKVSDRQWLHQQYVINNLSATDIAKQLGCDYTTVLMYCNKFSFQIKHGYNVSSVERSVRAFLDSINVEYVPNYVGLYEDNREVDIWIPSHNVAIEVNGVRWHSDLFRSNNYHQLKTDQLKSNVRLIQITDLQWNNKNQICRDIIRSAVNKNETIYGRKCEIQVAHRTNKLITSFFNENHIDRFIGGNLYIMLKYKDHYVSGIIVGKNRFNNLAENELLRYVTKGGVTVVGGFSKLINHYKKICGLSLISYLDKSLFNGSGYDNNENWIRLSDSKPGYFWTNGNDILSRYHTRKNNLSKLFEDVDLTKTENEIMHSHHYYRYFNAGNRRYLLKQ